jgi:predicted metalloprotease with PDZ domain
MSVSRGTLIVSLAFGGLVLATALPAASQQRPAAVAPAPAAAPLRSAAISNIGYEVTFDSATARTRSLRVAMSFDVAPGGGSVLLSLPTWTPGAYEVSDFAKRVLGFAAESSGRPLGWDKIDPDTWRIRAEGGRVTVRFDFRADQLDNAMAWARQDFVMFNGTNVFHYPEGRPLGFPATVTVRTQPDWKVATGMRSGDAAGTYREANYHDLVDMPFFVGRFDYDSMAVDGKTHRLASYPAGTLQGEARTGFWAEIGKMVPPESAVFHETPWEHYTTFLIFDSTYGGGSALEHQNSHVGIYGVQAIGNPLLASITAHEIFHAWNVKRLRPAEMVPYRYDRWQPTPWLWVSEGITDYYADLALVRGGIVDSTVFYGLTAEKVQRVGEAPPTALEDISLSTWLHPVDGSDGLYYPKGSLAGFLLDILIRDGSDNKRSLDDVMRTMYHTTYKRGRGFTAKDWWPAVTAAAGGRSFVDFEARYVDGRDPFPYDQVLPLAGLRLAADTVREPMLGVAAGPDSAGIRVNALQPGGAAQEAGVRVGDILLALGDLELGDPNFGPAYRERFRSAKNGDELPIKVRRGGQTLTLNGKIRLNQQVVAKIEPVPDANEKAVRIRRGIVTGRQ